jgi:hypothetical protein
MRMKRNFICVLGLVLTTSAAIAQMPTPSAELKKLDYFAGNWTNEATIPSGPWGAGGKFTASGPGEWLKGGFFLVNRGDFSMPPELGGNGTVLAVFGYDSDKKTYTEDRFDSLGRHVIMTGSLNGDTWTWAGENNYNGMTIKSRLTMKVVSPNSYTSKYEVSSDGGANWMTFWEGKGTKK